ncbi:hypothetical protein [Nocardia alni]|nr:hypothetical protein [Nocardia alni]
MGYTVDEPVRERVESATSMEQVFAWLDAAMTGKTVDEIFGD